MSTDLARCSNRVLDPFCFFQAASVLVMGRRKGLVVRVSK